MIPKEYIKYEPETQGTLSNGGPDIFSIFLSKIIQANSWIFPHQRIATLTYQKTDFCRTKQHLILIRTLTRHSIHIKMLAKIHVKQQTMNTLAFS